MLYDVIIKKILFNICVRFLMETTYMECIIVASYTHTHILYSIRFSFIYTHIIFNCL